MSGQLAKEVRQTKPFGTPEEEALMNLFRTAAVLQLAHAEALKPSGLSPAGYNVLRILRGAGSEGLRCHDIGERVLAPGPDVTRLLDRLEKRRFVARGRSPDDRRGVIARITPAGLEVLAGLDPIVRDLPRTLLGHLGKDRVTQFTALLEDARRPG
ncbi:MAG: MarR family transcriptional regulator [Planctomycetota bacterium]|nr:MAG: MarR family transcriptional regulator [Planctomycetota bacterium]